MPKKMTLPEFWDLLDKHDWHYDFSDDDFQWRKGRSERRRLLLISKQSPSHNDLFQVFNWHNATGELTKRPGYVRPSKPKRPE